VTGTRATKQLERRVSKEDFSDLDNGILTIVLCTVFAFSRERIDVQMKEDFQRNQRLVFCRLLFTVEIYCSY